MKALKKIRRAHFLLALLAVVAIGAMGCGSDTATAPATLTPEVAGTDPGTGIFGTITAEVLEALNRGIQDEFHAEAVYMKVIEDFGEVQPFYNIVYAEERHSEAIAKVFTNHGLPVPASEWNIGNVPSFASLSEACAGAVEAEIENIALYDELLTWDLPQDVRNVFTNIRAASLEQHLPAFEACCLCNQ